MADRQIFRMAHDRARRLAFEAVRSAPDGFIVEVRPPTRSLEQNARLWAMLTDVSEQVKWYGAYLTPDDWKDVFTASLRKARVVPTIDGDGFVPLGMRTSTMTKSEFGDLMTLIEAFGAEHKVSFRDAPVQERQMA